VVGVGFIVTVNTIKLSQPNVVDNVSRYVPAEVIVFPLNVVELPLHIARVIFVVGVGLMETVKTIKLSHPNDVVNVSLKVPAVEIVLPLKTIELPLQIACVMFVLGLGFTVRFVVIIESHPWKLGNVSK
jgi:hypothetical protein